MNGILNKEFKAMCLYMARNANEFSLLMASDSSEFIYEIYISNNL